MNEGEDYKSKYYLLYNRVTKEKEKISILDDVDFCIELIESDHINVAYIMNLIRNIEIDDINKRQKQIDFIREQLKRSNNQQLFKKIDLIEAFLTILEKGLSKGDIDEMYEQFEAEQRQNDIDQFITANPDIEEEQLTTYISEYEFSYMLDEGTIRDNITQPMGLLKKKSLVKRIVEFIKEFTEKYQ